MGVGSLHSEKYKKLCKELRASRKRKGVTQQQLADRLSKPQSFVAKYEKAERRLDVIEFVDIAMALQLNPALLLQNLSDIDN